MKTNSYVLIIISATLWATAGMVVRILATYGFTSVQIVVLRFIIAALCFGIYLVITDRQKLRIEKTDIKYFVAVSIFVMFAYSLCFVMAITLTSYAIASGLLYTAPIWAMLFSIYVFKEKLTKRKGVAICLSFTGCGLLTGFFSREGLNLTLIGLLVGLGAGIGYGANGVCTKKFIEKYNYVTVLFYFFSFASIFALPFSNFPNMISIFADSPMTLAYSFGGVLLSYIVPFALYSYALNFIEASRAAVVASVEPVVAACIGFFIYRELVNVSMLFGIALIISAIVTLYESAPKKFDTIARPKS